MNKLFKIPKRKGRTVNFKINPKNKPGHIVDPNNGYKVANRVKKVKQNPALPVNRVEVRTDQTKHGEDVLVVKVFATHGDGGLSTFTIVRPGSATDSNQLLQAIFLAGAAGAEHLCEMYGDRLDPETCGKYAKELGIEALKKLDESYRNPQIVV